MSPTKAELQNDCEDLLDLLEDVLEECHEHGCVHSLDVCQRVDEWLEPPEDGQDDDVVEIVPEK